MKPGLGGLLKSESAPMEPAEDGDAYEEGEDAATQAVMDAFKAGDVKAAKAALKDFIALCM